MDKSESNASAKREGETNDHKASPSDIARLERLASLTLQISTATTKRAVQELSKRVDEHKAMRK